VVASSGRSSAQYSTLLHYQANTFVSHRSRGRAQATGAWTRPAPDPSPCL